jgi:thiol-disulfide isomerase/thioredoxin
MLEIQFVSAPWCKSCDKIKPEFIAHCKIIGTEPIFINYDTMDEDFQATIKSLPTIKVRNDTDEEWTYFTALTFDAWKTFVINIALTKKTDDF